jgi:hypothetical protein
MAEPAKPADETQKAEHGDSQPTPRRENPHPLPPDRGTESEPDEGESGRGSGGDEETIPPIEPEDQEQPIAPVPPVR